MYLWFLTNPEILTRERTAIERLEESAEWLVGTNWGLDGGLYLDAVIRAHRHDYEVRMTYPNLFPKIPPTVRPKDAEAHWSNHQYGLGGGPLCLELGPDNWQSEMTGAQMIESAYNLLNIENPLGQGRPEVVIPAPSRHELSIGQGLRSSYVRFYIGHELSARIRKLSERVSGVFKFSSHLRSQSWLAMVHEIQPTGEVAAWKDCSIPNSMCGLKGDGALQAGIFLKTALDPAVVSKIDGTKGLTNILRQAGHETNILAEDGSLTGMEFGQPPCGVLIVDRANDPHFFVMLNENEMLAPARVRSETSASVSRIPENLNGLSVKSVGIVGLGSVGSKIALALGRMGIRRFFLVDYDVFLPENIVRHVLDWGSVGEHKVDGVCEMLSRLDVDIKVEVSRLHLTGQESTAAVSGTLDRLGQCDLLIDATANPTVFNLMTAAATAFEKSLVWMTIYAGGMGGMIARSRPGRDPDPQTMRAVYTQYCLEHPAPEMQVAHDYTAEDDEGQVLTASDADVAIIAHHAARFAADTLLECAPFSYPYSMYLIGLAKWWVFEAPFHTIPIATDSFCQTETKTQGPPEETANNLEFITELLKKKSNATASSS